MNRARCLFLAAVGCAAGVAFACGKYAEEYPPNGGGPDGGRADAPPEDGYTPPSTDGGVDACGTCGEDMVAVPTSSGPGFRIDATEVTQDRYAAFLNAKAGDVGGQESACAFNKTYAPTVPCAYNDFDPATHGKRPVTCVDWCDAFAYCRWAGKRLCGAVGGGSVPIDKFNTVISQWFAACSHNDDGQHARAYGNTFDGTRCNGKGYDAGMPIDVGSAAGCIGGFPGLHDMMGNVYEWEDACNAPDAGTSSQCQIRGGQYGGNEDYHSCDWGGLKLPRYLSSNDLGFRCCAP